MDQLLQSPNHLLASLPRLVISLVVNLASGETIETGMIGRDSLLGGSSALDGKVSLNKAIVQIAGAASALELDHLRSLADCERRVSHHAHPT